MCLFFCFCLAIFLSCNCLSFGVRHFYWHVFLVCRVSARCVRLSFTSTEWVEDQDNVITNDALEQQFGSLSDDPVDDILE